jgi:hypothetical protein
VDLKECINAVNTNQPFPGRREDFPSQQAYDAWLTREKKYLQGLMTIIVSNPSFSLSMGNEQDVGSTNLLSGAVSRKPSDPKRSSTYGGAAAADDVSLVSLYRIYIYIHVSINTDLQNPYTYIPHDPRAYFRYLMDMCMDLDTKIDPETERAKASVLSQASEDLLRQCYDTWRLTPPFRAVLYLELITRRLDTEESEGEIDIIEARDAMRALDKCLKENEIRNWTINDVQN